MIISVWLYKCMQNVEGVQYIKKEIEGMKVKSMFFMFSTSLSNQVGKQYYFKGKNFAGSLCLYNTSLFLNIAEFKKGAFFQAEITDEMIQSDIMRFPIFRKAEDLCKFLTSNKNMQISEQNKLLLPVQLIFQQRPFPTKIEILLEQQKFNDQNEKLKESFNIIEKASNQIGSLSKQLCEKARLLQKQQIKFKGKNVIVQTLKNRFRVENQGYQLKPFRHASILPSSGIHYFQVQITNYSSSLALGICVKGVQCIQNNKLANYEFLCLHSKGRLISNNSDQSVVDFQLSKRSIMEMVIDMNSKIIKWNLNENCLYVAQIPKKLLSCDFYPFVGVGYKGTIDFIEESE